MPEVWEHLVKLHVGFLISMQNRNHKIPGHAGMLLQEKLKNILDKNTGLQGWGTLMI